MPVSALIVEDSDFMRNLLTDILDETNIDIIGEATTGAEGIEMFTRHSPDLVLMDIVMSEKDGIEATAEITAADPETTVFMCTSVNQREKMKEAVKAGADGYITKPFQKRSVLAAIKDEFEEEVV